MHTWERRIMRIGALLLIVGAALSVGAFAWNGFSFDGLLDGEAYRQATYAPEGEFDRLDVSAVDAEIHIQPSQDGICRVVCDESEDGHYTVEVQNGVLTVYCEDNWRAGIGIHMEEPQLTMFLPEKDYAEMKVHSVSGDVNVSGLRIDALAMDATSGEIGLSQLTLGRLDVETVSGNVDMLDSVVTGDVNIRTTSGEIELENADSANFYITSVSGDVKGILCSGQAFDVHAVSGDVKLPQSAAGGAFKVSTTSGVVEIRVK